MPLDTHLDDPLLNDFLDFSRYPMFKAGNVKLSIIPRELSHRERGSSGPDMCRRASNVSELQLTFSTNRMKESWIIDLASARTAGDIANPPDDGDIYTAIHPSRSTTAIDILCAGSWCDHPQEISPATTTSEDSCDTYGDIGRNNDRGEDSFYSMDSADQDAHPLLLSMPIIPQIKLERKATVRKFDAGAFSDNSQNQSFLSPRTRDLRTPARISSRRYGRILSPTIPLAVVPDASPDGSNGYVLPTFQESRRSRSTSWNDHTEITGDTTELAYMHLASGPMLNSPCTLNDEKQPPLEEESDESLHSDVLLSMIEEAGSSPELHSNRPGSDTEEPSGLKRISLDHPKRTHQRSLVNHSISFSSLIYAVTDGCASLDHFLRKPKIKPKTTIKLVSPERVLNAHDPTSKWGPKQGQMIIKVLVPSTDDIWMFRVSEDISLTDFTSRVAVKLGFAVSFSGSLWDEPKYHFVTDERFKSWIKGRVRFGRNLPIVAHVLAPLPLVKLSVDGLEGCEVWCYA